MKVFERNKRPAIDWVFIMIFMGVGIWQGIKSGPSGAPVVFLGVFWFGLIVAGIWQYQMQKKQNQKDLIFLEVLKDKYGRDVYTAIQEEPRSLFYYVVQKRYPPFNRQSISLP
jgi:hypothetical protein